MEVLSEQRDLEEDLTSCHIISLRPEISIYDVGRYLSELDQGRKTGCRWMVVRGGEIYVKPI